MTMITPSAQLTLTKGNKSWVPGPPSIEVDGIDKLACLQGGGGKPRCVSKSLMLHCTR